MTKIYSFPYSQIGYDPPDPMVVVNLWWKDIILGRDVLNNFILTLNGLAQITEIPAENEPS